MYNILTDYVTKNNILSKYQFGFRKGYSTDMALAILIDKKLQTQWIKVSI